MARLAQARQALAGGRFQDALVEADLALAYPANLGEGRLAGWVDSEAHFQAGLALRAMAEPGPAAARFAAGGEARFDLSGARYYNDLPPEKAFYGTLCLAALGQGGTARERFLAMAEGPGGEPSAGDFFAVSLPDFGVLQADPERQFRLHARFTAALGQLGLGRTSLAEAALRTVLEEDPAHAPARALLEQLESGAWVRCVLPLIQGGVR
jgi:hypothetical protein